MCKLQADAINREHVHFDALEMAITVSRDLLQDL